MSKYVVTTVRLPMDILDSVKKRIKMEHVDKTTALREFLYAGIREWKMEKAVKMYKSGKSLSEVAEFAEVSVREMMEILVEKGVKSDMTAEDFRDELLSVENAL